MSSASASSLNLTGNWVGYYQCEAGYCAGEKFEGTTTLVQEAGSEVVTGHNGSEEVSGTLSGRTFTFTTTSGDEESFTEVTIEPGGNSWTGHSHAKSGISGTVFAQREPAVSELTPQEELEARQKESQEKEAKEKATKRSTETQVICNYEFATSTDVCNASVGDGGSAPVIAPTGTVTFTGPAAGSFATGATCTLAASLSAPAVPSCDIQFFTLESGLPTITATYSGDALHAPSSASTQFLDGDPAGTTTATSVEGAPGQYPSEVEVSTNIPWAGTTMQVCAQAGGAVGAASDVGGVLDSILSAIQKLSSVPGASSLTGTLADEQAAMDSLEKAVQAAEKSGPDAGTGGPAVNAEESRATTDLETIKQVLKSQSSVEKQQDVPLEHILEQLVEGLREVDGASCGATAPTAAASVPSIKQGFGGRRRHLGNIAYLTRSGVPAGPLKIELKLSRRALAKAARHRHTIELTIRLNMLLPSKVFPHGYPLTAIKHVTLTRASRCKTRAGCSRG